LADFLLHNAYQSRHLSSQKPSSGGRQLTEYGEVCPEDGLQGLSGIEAALTAVTVHNQILSSDALKPSVKTRAALCWISTAKIGCI